MLATVFSMAWYKIVIICNAHLQHTVEYPTFHLYLLYIRLKSDWSRAFNQFTIACELDMINAISAADIAFVMSSSTSALECSPQKQNG